MWFLNMIITLLLMMTALPEMLKKDRQEWMALGSILFVSYKTGFAFAFSGRYQLVCGSGDSVLDLIGGWCWFRFILLSKARDVYQA